MNPLSRPHFPAAATSPAMKRNASLPIGALCAALLLLPAAHTLAQNAKPPTQLTYQGFLTDGNGVPFGNTSPTNKTVIFRIYDVLSGGTTAADLKWSSQQVVTVDKGYFSVLLGQGSAGPEGASYFNADLTGIFTGVGASDRYLELTADGTTIAPRLRFLPAPYAMLAKSATELLDPATGVSSFSIGGGNLTASGNLGGYSLSAISGTTSHAQQGAYLEWNKDGANGMSYFLNQRGSGGGGLVFGEVSPANTITERMRIDGSGNVGIGTSTPGGKLEVSGDYNQSSLLSLKQSVASWGTAALFNSYKYISTSGGDPASTQKQFIVGAGGVSIGYPTVPVYGSSDALYVSGNVGIGTSAPVGRLNLSEATGTVATANAGSLVLDHGNSGGSSSILFRSTSNRGSDFGFINYQDNAAGSSTGGENAILTIGTQNDGDDHIALMPSGNVGVGTTSPAAKLDVVGNARASGNLTVGGSLYATGNVGFGTSTPGARLEVDASFSQTPMLLLNQTTPSWSSEASFNSFRYIQTQYAGSGSTGLSELKPFQVGPGGVAIGYTTVPSYGSSDALYVGGNVGIGTTAPGFPLTVKGYVSASIPDSDNDGQGGSSGQQGIERYDNRGSAGATKGVAYTGNITVWAERYYAGQGVLAFSDRRIKQIAGRSDTAADLRQIRQLAVTDYRMVDQSDRDNRVHKGFIAQEVQQHIPEAVVQSRNFVPTIYSRPAATRFDASNHTLAVTMTNAHTLKAGEIVRLVTDKEQLDLKVMSVPSPTEFVVGLTNAPGRLFVYGKQVDDFLSVDYNRVFSTGIGAIQELSRQVERQAAALQASEAHVAELQHAVARLGALETDLAEMKKLVARLTGPNRGESAATPVTGTAGIAGTR